MQVARLVREGIFYAGVHDSFARAVRLRALTHVVREGLRATHANSLDDIPASLVVPLRAELTALVQRVHRAERAQLARVERHDATRNPNDPDIASLNLPNHARDNRLRLFRTYASFHSLTPQRLRQRLLTSIVWDTCLVQPDLLDGPPTRLNQLVDRHLRTVERMVYDVGVVPDSLRRWSRSARRGQWVDGLGRTFEYPRVRAAAAGRTFLHLCDPSPRTSSRDTRDCRGAMMEDWYLTADERHVAGPLRLNPMAAQYWNLETVSSGSSATTQYANAFRFNPSGIPGRDNAIRRIFWPSTSFDQRNLFFCDHVIHAIMLEALHMSRGGGEWYPPELAAGPRAIRWFQLGMSGVPRGNEGAFWNDTRYFTRRRVERSGVRAGDWLWVTSHPAHRHSAEHVVFASENAFVVQTVPELLLQGHGTAPQTERTMVDGMIQAFNRNLDELRRRVAANLAGPRPLVRIPIARGDDLVPFTPPVDPPSAGLPPAPDPREPGSWYIRWPVDEYDADALQGVVRRRVIRQQQHVTYARIGEGTFGFFPLYRTTFERRRLHVEGEMRCDASMVAPWHLLAEVGPARNLLTVVSPNE